MMADEPLLCREHVGILRRPADCQERQDAIGRARAIAPELFAIMPGFVNFELSGGEKEAAVSASL